LQPGNPASAQQENWFWALRSRNARMLGGPRDAESSGRARALNVKKIEAAGRISAARPATTPGGPCPGRPRTAS